MSCNSDHAIWAAYMGLGKKVTGQGVMEGNTERDHNGETLGFIALFRKNGRQKSPQILNNLPGPTQRKLFKQFSQRHDSEVRHVYHSSPAV